jgi:hypothetical protein
MQWLSPAAWLGLVALALPVIIHLFSRRPARTEPFPSLRFLAASPLLPTRRTRVSDWPLLLVRLLVLLLAVLALAQPYRVRRTVRAGGAGGEAVAQVMDTVGAGADTAVAVRDTSRAAPRVTQTLLAADLPARIDDAVAWLRTQPAPRALVIVSSFEAGVLDSLTLARIPRDVRVSLVPRAVAARLDDAGRVRTGGARVAGGWSDTVRWVTALTPADIDAVQRAVRALDGPVVRVMTEADAARDTAACITVRTAPGLRVSGSRRLTRASVEIAAQVALDDAVYDAVRDAVPSSGVVAAADSLTLMVSPDVAGRAAITIDERGDSLTPRVRITSQVTERPSLALALLLAASPHAGQSAWRPAGTTPVSRTTLDAWQQAPSAPPIGTGTGTTDVHAVDTDARWLWLLVLLALVVEFLMRRRATARTTTPDRAA